MFSQGELLLPMALKFQSIWSDLTVFIALTKEALPTTCQWRREKMNKRNSSSSFKSASSLKQQFVLKLFSERN